MNEQEHASQLSALYDDELPAPQAELVVRRALKDPHLRDAWSRYSLIGAAMRGEPLAGLPGEDLAACVSARLAGEPAVAAMEPDVAATGEDGAGRSWARGAWGMAVAASVAAVSLLVLRAQAPGPQDAVQLAAVDAAVSAQPAAAAPAAPVAQPAARAAQPAGAQALAARSEPPSYTTPVDNSVPGQLINYVVAHSDVQASVVRFSPMSSVVSASYDPAEGAVDMSEAEIGAHR